MKLAIERLQSQLGVVDMVPVPEVVLAKSSPCRALVFFYIKKYVHESAPLQFSAWRDRDTWTLEFTAKILKFLRFSNSLGIQFPSFPRVLALDESMMDVRIVFEFPPFIAENPAKAARGNLVRFINYLAVAVIQGSRSRQFELNLQDPFVVFFDSVRRYKGESEFDYDKWISVFTDEQAAKSLNPLQVKVIQSEHVASWWGKFDECVPADTSHVTDCMADGIVSDCAFGTEYVIKSSKEMLTSKGADVDRYTEPVFRSRTSNPMIDHKLVRFRYLECLASVKSVCFERSTLEEIDGLDGSCPRQHNFTTALPRCQWISILTDHLDGTLEREWLANSPAHVLVIEFSIQAIRILKKLHQAGFCYNANYNGDFVVNVVGTGGMTVKLKDLQYVRPMTSKDGDILLWGSDANPMALDIKLVLKLLGIAVEGAYSRSLKQATDLVEYLGVFEIPEYDRIIALLVEAKSQI